MGLLGKLLAGLALLLLPAPGRGAESSRKTDQADRAIPAAQTAAALPIAALKT